MRCNDYWLSGLLGAVSSRQTVRELEALWLRWRSEIEGHGRREEIIAEFKRRKEALRQTP